MPAVASWQQIKINADLSFVSAPDGKLPDGRLLAELTAAELPTELAIVGSNFSMEQPLTVIFPKDTPPLNFICCNLDNLLLPAGSKLCKDTCNMQYQVQADGEKWVCDVAVDAKDATKITLTPVVIIGTAAAIADWETKRETPLDLTTLVEKVAIEEPLGESEVIR